MRFLLLSLFFILGCPKKTEDAPVYITPINDPIEFEEDLDDLPEADDTGGYLEEEDYLEWQWIVTFYGNL